MSIRSISSIAVPVFVLAIAAPLRFSDAGQEKTPPASAPAATWKGDPYSLPTDAVSGEKLDAAVIAKQGPTYVMKKCAVSNEDLGSMGEPVDYVVGNRLIRMCCKGCKGDVVKDPMKYLTFPDRQNETEAEEKAKDSK